MLAWRHFDITSYNGDHSNQSLIHAVFMTIPNKICNLEMAYNGTVDGIMLATMIAGLLCYVLEKVSCQISIVQMLKSRTAQWGWAQFM